MNVHVKNSEHDGGVVSTKWGLEQEYENLRGIIASQKR